MDTDIKRPSWNILNPTSPLQTAILACFVAALCYIAPTLEGALIRHPQTAWPLWPGCALLVPLLLLVPQRIWLVVIPSGFAAFVLYDLQAGVSLRSIAWFIPADTVQVLIAALLLSYFFDGLPRLNNVNALAKYLFFVVIVAPSIAALISARGIQRNYWDGWKIGFFSEVLAFVTLTPVILSWVSDGRTWMRKSYVYYLEVAALLSGHNCGLDPSKSLVNSCTLPGTNPANFLETRVRNCVLATRRGTVLLYLR